MDSIDKIIARKGYKNLPLNIYNKTWRDFEIDVGKGKFYLFGIGAGADLYFFKYGNFSKVERAFDNKEEVQGLTLSMLTADFDGCCSVTIEKPKELENSGDKNPIVLISSFNYFDEIAKELESYGIKKYYSVFCMEMMERIYHHNISMYSRDVWLKNIQMNAINPKKICIYSDCDGAGHAKEIVRCLLSMRTDLQIVWIVKNWYTKLDNKIVKRLMENRCAREFEYKTSYVWIGDSGGSGFPTVAKKYGHIGIGLKHWSSITLKKFALDEKAVGENQTVKDAILSYKQHIDYIMVGSEFDEETCRSGFNIDDKYIRIGSPRSDILFRNDRKMPFFNDYQELKGKKLLLYAPTFRRTGKDMSNVGYRHELDFEMACQSMKSRFGGDWCILLRLHPMVAKYSKEIVIPDYVIDVSNYQDAEELVAACDALVTDYSSIMFEPAYINIPVFLFATDLEEYTSQERDFYIDYETLPFPIAKSNEELRKNIVDFDEQKYKNDVKVFFNKYGVREDGHAAERAAKFISDLIDEKVKEEKMTNYESSMK
ncbi:CDP-glycerol glycerophosphotransferase family protein [Selenomonas sp. ND2010]|uniref:CDP-glycerol glycerophosphotransferase family protein n=1 Tax=Selenomonas sp. ND2010 TaxID=1410618 RepID=UPI00051B2F6D|nr:CDP-glycerol glycerophosphotransferase family protein [Selenomonas sp. ND2010]